MLGQSGKPAEALESFRRALAIQQKLAEDYPAIPDFRNNLASSHTDLADTLRILGRFAEARENYDQAIALREKLVKDNPTVTEFRSGMARSVRRLGLVRPAAGDLAGAVAYARKAMIHYENLPQRSWLEWYDLA